MPGKVNPTQSEARTMVASRVIGNGMTVTGASGNFELNVYLPVIACSLLQSMDLLASVTDSFNDYCAAGIEANRERIEQNLHRSLTLVTALNPQIGYERAAEGAKTAICAGKDSARGGGGEGPHERRALRRTRGARADGESSRSGLSAAIANCHPPTEEGGGSAVISFNLSMLGLRLAAGGKSLWRE